ncbi:MAG: hypothetical protein KAY59_10225 [Acidobacteria bacterium]|nr:hypothetical protein [Acidobacteriota bacterium]
MYLRALGPWPAASVRRALSLALLLAAWISTSQLAHSASPPRQSQATGPAQFLTVKAWQLSWSTTSTQRDGGRVGSGSSSGGGLLTFGGDTEAEGIVESTGSWAGRVPASGSTTYTDDRGQAGTHREGSGSIQARAEFVVDVKQRTYSLHVYCDDSVPATAYDWRPDTPRRNYRTTVGLVCPSAAKQPLPSGGGSITGTITHRDEGNGLVVTSQWSLTPAETENYEVLIEPVGNYDKWLPEGHLTEVADEATGANSIQFRVMFQKVGGGTPSQTPESFTFDLLDTSREPGVALNYPLGADADRRHDLRFHEGDGRFSEVSEDGQQAITESPDDLDFKVTVHSYDFGAYGQLRVTATMAGGHEILGRFVPTGRERIPIPRDDDGDRVADDWEAQYGVGGDAVGSDNDAKPTGQASPGDGIPLFEEYRGFVRLKGRGTERAHIRTDPTLKSLFVIDAENLFKPEDWVDATGMESFRLSPDMVGPGDGAKPAARNATNVNRQYAKGPGFDYAIRLQTQGGTAGRADQLGYAEIFPDVADNPSQAAYIMVSPSRIRRWVSSTDADALPAHLERMYAEYRAGTGPIRDESTARLVLDAQRELLTNPAIVTRLVERLVAKTVVHEVAHACGMYHHGVDPVVMSADPRQVSRGERTCPARYHNLKDLLAIAVMETLFPRTDGMLLDAGKFCSESGCWRKLKARDW